MIPPKILGSAAVAALALMAFASTASATTLEVGATKQTGAVTIKASLKSGTSMVLKDTGGSFANTCTVATMEGNTETFTGTTVGGRVSTLTASSCTDGGGGVDQAGSFTVENIAGTTNGTVRSLGAKVTTSSPFGELTCTTSSSPGTDIGTLTGVASGSATMDINAVLNCGFFLPSAKWEGSATVTSPSGLGVSS